MIKFKEGNPLLNCPNCKESVSLKAKFCPECGHHLRADTGAIRRNFSTTGAEARSASQTQIRRKQEAAQEYLKGARRLVTVMFADIQGFTGLCEKMDPEQVTDLMNLYLGRLGGIVHEYEGYIDKFIGDCIMALFGAPLAHENDPELAVRTAIKMIQELQSLNQELGHDLRIRIGINTGLVVAGGVGTDDKFDFTVMGDAVNTAQRLQSVGQANQIIVGKSVAQACQQVFEFEALAPLELKGKSEPIPAYRVKSFRKFAKDKKSLRDAQRPLIGRDHLLQELAKRLDRLCEGRSRSLILEAEAGIGKSRLKPEVRRLCLDRKIAYVEVAGTSHQMNTPFRGLKSLASRLLDDVDINSLALHPADRQVLGFLKGIDSKTTALPEDTHTLKGMVRATMQRLLKLRHSHEPLALFIDDFHFFDPISREILLSLANEKSDDQKLGEIYFFSQRPDGSRIHPNFDTLQLEALTPEQSMLLAQKLLNTTSLPPDLSELLFDRTQGNPFFIEEVLRLLLESGRLVKRQAEWIFVVSDKDLPVPQSIQALITSRVDRLYPLERKVLEAASVLGRSFRRRHLAALLEGEENLDEAIPFLRKKEFFFESAISSQETEYTFGHSLTRDVIYESILLKRRKELHRQAAEVLMKELEHHQEERLEGLTFILHHLQKSDSDPELRAKFHLQLAEEHQAIASWDQAQSQLETVVKILVEFSHPLRVQAEITLANLFRRFGNLSSAEEVLNRIPKALITAQKADLQIAWALSKANLLRAMGRVSDAVQFGEQALELTEHSKKPLIVPEVLNDLAVLKLSDGKLLDAKKCLEVAIQSMESKKDWKLVQKILNNKASICFIEGDFIKAESDYLLSLEAARKLQDLWSEMLCLHNLGLCYFHRKDFSVAKKYFLNSQQWAQALQSVQHHLTNQLWLTTCDLYLNPRPESPGTAETLLQQMASQSQWKLFAEGTTQLSRFYSAQGDFESARRLLTSGIDKSAQSKDPMTKKRLELELQRLIKKA